MTKKSRCSLRKKVDHLPSTYHRYEIRLRDKKTVYDFIKNELKREEILSELVFLKKIPTLDEIQIASGCTLMRAKLVSLVIEDCNKLNEMNKRAKKEVTEILRKLNVLNLAFDVENLLPYYSICDGGLLKEEVIPNTLIGETMVYLNIEENH